MQVTETLKSGLKREIKVVIPSADLNEKLNQKLEDARARVRINGFRPGKVPVQYLRKMHGTSFMAEVLDEIFNQTPPAILTDRGENSATAPKIDVSEDEAALKTLLAGESDLVFTMNYEVLPAVEVKDHASLAVTRENVVLDEEKVAERLEKLLEMTRSYQTKEGAAEKGDRVTIDYLANADGLEAPAVYTDARLKLGEGVFAEFDEALSGLKAGDKTVVKRQFVEGERWMPDQTGKEVDFAGRQVTFDITVKQVEQADELVIDDEAAKKFGFESLEKLRETVRESMVGEFKELAHQRVKRQILDQLDKLYRFDVPSTLVDVEFNNIWSQFTREMKQEGSNFTAEQTTEEEARSEYHKLAERRVRLGLVLSEIGKQANVTVSDDEFVKHVQEFIRRYPQQEKQILETLRSSPDAAASLRAPLYEDKVIAHLLEVIQVEDRQITPEELAEAESAYEAAQSAEKNAPEVATGDIEALKTDAGQVRKKSDSA